MTPSAPGMGTQGLGHLPSPIDVTSFITILCQNDVYHPFNVDESTNSAPQLLLLICFRFTNYFLLNFFLIEICTNT